MADHEVLILQYWKPVSDWYTNLQNCIIKTHGSESQDQEEAGRTR